MKKVLFKKWIDAKYPPYSGKQFAHKDRLEGTGCWSDFIHEGVFHQWSSAYEEGENGFGNYTVALVEVANGTIESVLPSVIKFIENTNKKGINEDTFLRDTDIPMRAVNVLHLGDIKKLGDFRKIKKSDLLEITGVGEKASKKIEEYLSKINIILE